MVLERPRGYQKLPHADSGSRHDRHIALAPTRGCHASPMHPPAPWMNRCAAPMRYRAAPLCRLAAIVRGDATPIRRHATSRNRDPSFRIRNTRRSTDISKRLTSGASAEGDHGAARMG
jgi:hypothetical protein